MSENVENAVKVAEVIPLFSCGCCIQSFYFNWPNCLGCITIGDILCCDINLKMCKIAENPAHCCTFIQGSLKLNMPATCMKCMTQFCCIDCRVGIPCDQDIVNIWTILGLTFCYKNEFVCKCCSPVADINPIFDVLEKDFRANYQFAKESVNSANKPSGAQAHGQVNWN